MADNIAAKAHLNSVKSKLDDITRVDEINSIINRTSLKLCDNLLSDNLFVDKKIKSDIDIIRRKLGGGAGTLLEKIRQKLNRIDNDLNVTYPDSPGNRAIRGNLIAERDKLDQIAKDVTNPGTDLSDQAQERHNEYDRLYNYVDNFDLDAKIPDIDVNIETHTAPITNLNDIFVAPGSPNPPQANGHTARYHVCDADGKELRENGGNYIVNIGGKNYEVSGLILGADTLDVHNINFVGDAPDLPQDITLSINSTYDEAQVGMEHMNVICNKIFKLTLHKNPVNCLFQFDYYNTGAGGGKHIIEESLETELKEEQDGGKQKLQRDALERALRHDGGTLYDTLTESQKLQFLEKVLKDVTIIDFASMVGVELKYNQFRNWFTKADQPWNKDKNIIKSNGAYQSFINNNLQQKVNEFISSKLDEKLQNPAINTKLKGELSTFVNDIEKNKVDSNLNSVIDGRINGDNAYKMEGGPRYSRDRNYMRFFSGASTELKNQKVDIYTKLGENEPVKYDLKMNITGKNNIAVEIKIDGQKEPIRLSSGEPTALVRRVLREQKIKYGKVRAHIGYNIYKAMVQLAKEKDFSLQYRGTDGQTNYIDLDGNNIVIRKVKDLTTLNRDDDTIVFEQQKFENSNKFGGTDNSLEEGLMEIGKHLNYAMNEIHRQYRDGTERRVLGIINSRNRMRLPTVFWLSPIKKLLNMRNSTNFDFDTTVDSNGKSVNIKFARNKFTINMEGLKKPIKSRDLGRILNKKQKGSRVFDGMERDIVEGIYVALIDKLRENGKIANTDFGAMDNVSGNMYVLSKDGTFGMIPKEDLENQGTPMTGTDSWWLGSGSRYRKDFGVLNHERLDKNSLTWFEKGSTQEREIMKNPFIMQRFVKAMNRRMGLGENIRSIFVN